MLPLLPYQQQESHLSCKIMEIPFSDQVFILFMTLQTTVFSSSITVWLSHLRWGLFLLSLLPFNSFNQFLIHSISLEFGLILNKNWKVMIYVTCWFCVFCRWNSWNFFACNINETVIKETGLIFFLSCYLLLDESFMDSDDDD